jgi:tetratricopeptide (TPR) repeat protein/tRNA A-37 threonylcarbamoyl transferase component Bud32
MADLRNQLQSTLTGSYTLERELGGGGMSRVFLADETRLGRKVVIKVLAPELAAGISAERFQREIKLAASLQQANIVPVLSAGESQGLPYYTMPFVEGESLRKRLGAGTAPGITETVRILGDIARALSYAHEHGIVHRDIKPDNVLLSHGTAVVTDFGIAKAVAAARTGDGAVTLTQLGASIGTPAYMAPEQAAGDDNIDHRVDIYAFGCLAYELLTGRPPFAAKTTQRMMAAQMSETPQNVSEVRADTPTALAALVMRCLEKDPAARPQSSAELMGVLDSVSSGGLPSMPAVLLGGPAMFKKALAIYAVAFGAVAILARAAIIAIGLPDWVFPGALIVMALGLPVILFAGYAHRTTMRALTVTPSRTPGGTMEQPSTLASIAIKAGPKLSWARVARGGYAALGAFALIVATFMGLRAAGIGPAGSLFGKGALAANDLLLVAEFSSPQSDSALGVVIAEALRQSLSQSRAVMVAAPTFVAEGLQRMQRPAGTRLDFALARELAEREGMKAVVHGDVASAGSGFIITARLSNAASGIELTSYRSAAKDATELIPAVDELSRDLRAKIGESLRSVHASPPLMKVTTTSLPAFRKFTEAMRLHYEKGDPAAAAAKFEEAIALDSTFATAYGRAANSWGQAAVRVAHSDSLRRKALQFAERLPDAERYNLLAQMSSGRRDSVIYYTQKSLEADPKQSLALNLLGNIQLELRQYAQAEASYRRAMALNDGNWQPGTNLISALVGQGKFDEARHLASERLGKRPNGDAVLLSRVAVIDLIEGKYDAAEANLLAASKLPRNTISRASGFYLASFLQTRGQIAKGQHLRDSLLNEDLRVGNRTAPINVIARLVDSIGVDILSSRRFERATKRADALLAKYPVSERGGISSGQVLSLGMWFAYAGDNARALAAKERFKREVRDTVPVRRSTMDLLEMYVAANEGRGPEAIALAKKVDTTATGLPTACGHCLSMSLSHVHDRLGNADSGIKYLEQYVTTPAYIRWGVDEGMFSAAILRLGELYEAKGNKTKAGEYYRRFVDLWSRAEPDLQPKVAEVRRRIARLADVERRD